VNVYVISNVWDHGGSKVLGAATDRSGAERIGDQQPGNEEMRGAWAPWVERVDPAAGSCWWERVALHADESMHPSLSQEIVRVPLADKVEAGESSADLARRVRSESRPTTYPATTAEIGKQVVDAIRARLTTERD
jgi:hypothetical protein